MYSKIAVASSARVVQTRRSSSICIEPKNDSIMALSNADATRPWSPAGRLRGVGGRKANWCIAWIQLVVRNTPIFGMSRWVLGSVSDAVRLYRGQFPLGQPTVAWRQDRVRFWQAIAEGDDRGRRGAGGRVRRSVSAGSRHAGGVNPQLSETVSGRYLSPHEREDIALMAGSRCWGA